MTAEQIAQNLVSECKLEDLSIALRVAQLIIDEVPKEVILRQKYCLNNYRVYDAVFWNNDLDSLESENN